MASSTQRVEGLDQLLKNLQALPRELASKNGGPVRSALFRAAKIIRDEARDRAPVDTGNLEKSIVTKRDRNPKAVGANERYVVSAKPGKRLKYGNTKANVRKRRAGQEYQQEGSAFYWRFIEFGTEKFAAAPFMRPAFETRKDDAVQEFKTSLEKGIARVVRKMRK